MRIRVPPAEPGQSNGAVSPCERLVPGPEGTLDCCFEHEYQILDQRQAPWAAFTNGRWFVEVLVERCAALDVHKDMVTVCVRQPGPKVRKQEVREFRTYTSSLGRLREWLESEGVTQIAMEATGVYWR